MVNPKRLIKQIHYEVRQHEQYGHWFIAIVLALAILVMITLIKAQIISPGATVTHSYQLNLPGHHPIYLMYSHNSWGIKNTDHKLLSTFNGIDWNDNGQRKIYRFYHPRLVNIEKDFNRSLQDNQAIIILGNIPTSQLNLKSNPLEHLIVVMLERTDEKNINVYAQPFLSFEKNQSFLETEKIKRMIGRLTPLGKNMNLSYKIHHNKSRIIGSLHEPEDS